MPLVGVFILSHPTTKFLNNSQQNKIRKKRKIRAWRKAISFQSESDFHFPQPQSNHSLHSIINFLHQFHSSAQPSSPPPPTLPKKKQKQWPQILRQNFKPFPPSSTPNFPYLQQRTTAWSSGNTWWQVKNVTSTSFILITPFDTLFINKGKNLDQVSCIYFIQFSNQIMISVYFS